MACEKAIITTNLPNIREIVDDSAIIVDPYSPKQIAKAVILLSKDIKLRKKLGKKARKRIVQKYNLKIMLNEYEKIYLKLNT